MMEWALLPLKRYAEFSGRSRRKEYWLFLLVAIFLYVVAATIDTLFGLMFVEGFGGLTILVWLALFIPSIAVGVRRLHDTDRSGWWMLLSFVPLLGLVTLVFMLLDGTKGPNQYGPDPKDPDHSEIFA
jgi:uncharacterized membrane protein YhaH (DUF805 family)